MAMTLGNNVDRTQVDGAILAENLRNITDNRAYLKGYLEEPFQYSHSSHEISFYRAMMRIPRLSGKNDYVPIMVSKNGIMNKPIEDMKEGESIEVEGRFTSYNERNEDGKTKLHLYLYAANLNCGEIDEEQPQKVQNFIFLNGHICKPPVFRYTPLNKRILDLMVAVNRKYGRADYIPCIAWGAIAESFSWQLKVGSPICFWGRIQSRIYTKRLDTGVEEERTTREVSIMRIM